MHKVSICFYVAKYNSAQLSWKRVVEKRFFHII